jgi:glycosyltransferase involved in cell wall biosynthesis
MNALVIAPQPFFTPRGTPFSVYHRTRIAAELGVSIDLLTYGVGQDVDLPGVRTIRIPRIRALEPIKVGPSIPKIVLDVLMVLWTIALLTRRKYDFVHAHEEAVFFCLALKPIFRFKLVYDMHSSLPQQLTNFDFTKSRFLIGLFERLEQAALEASDAVLTISPALARYAESHVDDPGRHLLIENSLFEPVRLSGPAGDHDGPKPPVRMPVSEGQPIIAYAGTFEPYQGIDLLLAALARVLDVRPDVGLLLIGGSEPQVETYRNRAVHLGIVHRCVFTGVVPQREAQSLVQHATLVVSPRTQGDNTPLKIYEQLAGGIPLVATRVPSHTQVLDENVCFLADPDPVSFARALLEALDDAPRRARTVAAARALYGARYSHDSYVEKMQRLLELLA